jgi:hypothetical protein
MVWRELGKTWHDTTVDYCDVCGNLLIRRYWEFAGADGSTVRACREDDERLYHRLRQLAPSIEEARRSANAAATSDGGDGAP